MPRREGTIVSPQDPQSYVVIAKKNYGMKWSSSHWHSDNQLRLDLNEADNLIKNIKSKGKPLRSKEILALPDCKQRVTCINRSFEKRDRYLVGTGEKKIYSFQAEKEKSGLLINEIRAESIKKVTLSLFFADQFIIGGESN